MEYDCKKCEADKAYMLTTEYTAREETPVDERDARHAFIHGDDPATVARGAEDLLIAQRQKKRAIRRAELGKPVFVDGRIPLDCG